MLWFLVSLTAVLTFYLPIFLIELYVCYFRYAHRCCRFNRHEAALQPTGPASLQDQTSQQIHFQHLRSLVPSRTSVVSENNTENITGNANGVEDHRGGRMRVGHSCISTGMKERGLLSSAAPGLLSELQLLWQTGFEWLSTLSKQMSNDDRIRDSVGVCWQRCDLQKSLHSAVYPGTSRPQTAKSCVWLLCCRTKIKK